MTTKLPDRHLLLALISQLCFLAACQHSPQVKTPTKAPAEPTAVVVEKPEPPTLQTIAEPKIWNSARQVRETCDRHLETAGAIRKQIEMHQGTRDEASTLAPFNLMLVHVDRIQPRSELFANVHPDKAVREASELCDQRAKKFLSDIKLDRGLYDALRAVKPASLDARTGRFLRHLLRDYRRAGVDRDPETRARLAELDAKRVKLEQTFSRNIREDKLSMQVTEKQLAGMPEDFLASRRKEGQKTITITTDYPDFYPVQTYARDASVRRQLYRLYLTRAFPKNAEVLDELLNTRHTYATLLGYADWAAYSAEDKMVKTKQVIEDFLTRVTDLGRPRMKNDLSQILRRKLKDNRRAKSVAMWDRFYYVNKIQAEKFGVDTNQVRAHFPFERVKTGLLELTQELFGLVYRRVPDAAVWHQSVEVYDIYDDDKRIARFYLDLHPRDGKYGHAGEFPVISGVQGLQLPSAALVTNFPRPTSSDPALTEHHQVTVFFHEFGHLLHQLLGGQQRWVTQSGITCEWDFVEAPSQLLEEWTWDAEVLARFARHHKTGTPIPDKLVQRMNQAREFGKGVHVMRQMFYAWLSFATHNQDPSKIELKTQVLDLYRRVNPYPYEPETAVWVNFGHLSGYSSMYYTYMWSSVLAKDLFTRFSKNGLMDRATADAFREAILEPGGSLDATEMVQRFLGRPYAFDAFQQWLQRR